MIIPQANYVKCQLVLMPQNEMTSQANDILLKMWVYQQQYMLREKGPGWGLHQSDTINSVVRWLKGGPQTLEYGKYYERYWAGNLFVKQVRQCCIHLRLPLILNSQLKERIIPTFEEALGPGYQALIIVDNLQGHSAYGKDALVATCMNINPGGNQPQMHDTCFIQDGEKITQTMVYPPSHPKYPNMPKGIKAVLTKHGLYQSNLCGKCARKCVSEDCCNKQILEYQPDFQGKGSSHQKYTTEIHYTRLNFFIKGDEVTTPTIIGYLFPPCDIMNTLIELIMNYLNPPSLCCHLQLLQQRMQRCFDRSTFNVFYDIVNDGI